jgi:hypothetical protein
LYLQIENQVASKRAVADEDAPSPRLIIEALQHQRTIGAGDIVVKAGTDFVGGETRVENIACDNDNE